MAGHSPWKNIKHKKAAIDAKRGKVWSKCARAIIVAAKAGGGDPTSNLSLRYAIEEARFENMPKATIENAIKKGTGELAAESYEAVTYEGYGPGGVAIILDVLTDNRQRTVPELKNIFERRNGNMGTSGCVSYAFTSKGLLTVKKEAAGEEKVMDVALEAGAEDVTDAGENWEIVTGPTELRNVQQKMEAAGLKPDTGELTMIPNTTITISGETARRVLAMIEEFEDNEDVQKVHANFVIPEAELAELGGE